MAALPDSEEGVYVADQPAVQSPEWWLDRLYKRICDRTKKTDKYNDYYECDHPLPHLHSKARDPFRRLLRMARANYMELVVDALVGRLEVAGIQSQAAADGASDQQAWSLWQANGLDAGSQLVFLEAAIYGQAYLLVAPPGAGQSYRQVTPEHPTQAITETRPGSQETAAGMKLWVDDWTGKLCSTVYLPEGLYKYDAPEPKVGQQPQWSRRQVAGEDWGARNPLGEVPLVEVANRPRMLQPGRSELASVTDVQDRINKTLADRLMTQEFAAFPQKWATGLEIPEDDQGQPVEPFDVAVNKILISEDAGAKFGQFEAASLDGYLRACESDVKDIAAITSTPPHYLLGSLVNLSAEALKAAEAGLIHKVYQRRVPIGEALERTLRLAGVAGPAARIVWKSPEWRTEGELVDALVKMSTLGVPREVLWERWGATPQEITRWQELSQQALDRALGGDLAAAYGPKPGDPLTGDQAALGG